MFRPAPAVRPRQQFVFHRAVTASFRAAVPGSTVWVSMFSWDADRVDVQSDSIAAAKDAHARGVNVRVLLYHKRFQSEAIRSLAATLGTDTTQRSWAKVCVGACLGGSGAELGVHHAKLLVFSKIATAGGRFITDLTYVSSANLTGSNSVDSWNNTTVIPNDPTIAKAATGYMADMVRDAHDLNTGPVASGIYRIDRSVERTAKALGVARRERRRQRQSQFAAGRRARNAMRADHRRRLAGGAAHPPQRVAQEHLRRHLALERTPGLQRGDEPQRRMRQREH